MTDRFPMQGRDLMEEYKTIPRFVAERAYREYVRLYGSRQSLDRLAERGGFAWGELGILLAGDLQQHPDAEAVKVKQP